MNKSSSHNNIILNSQKDINKTNSLNQINYFDKPTYLNTNSSIKSMNKAKYRESYKPHSNKYDILRKQSNIKLNEIKSMIGSLSSNNFFKSSSKKNNLEEKLEAQSNINNSISLNNSQYINDSTLNIPLIGIKYNSNNNNNNNSNIKNKINKSKRKRLKIESNYEEYNNTFNDLAKEMKKKEEMMHNKFLNLKSNSSSIFKSLKTFDIKNNQAQKKFLNSNFEKNDTSKLQFKMNINKNSLRLLQVTNEKGFHNRNKANNNININNNHTHTSSIHSSKLREDDELHLFKSNKEFHRITMNTLFNGKNILKNYKNQYNNFIYDVGNNLSKKNKASLQDGKGFNTFYMKNSKNYREVKDFDLSINKKNIIRNAHFLRNERNINKLKTIEETLLKIDENLINDFNRNHEKDYYVKSNVDNTDNHGKLFDEESYISNTSNNKTKNIFDNKLDLNYHNSNNDDILLNKHNNQCNDGNDDEFIILKDLDDLNTNSNDSKQINSLILNNKLNKNNKNKINENIDININGIEHSNLINLRTSRSKTFFNQLPINIFNTNEINRLFTDIDEKKNKKEQKRSNKNIKFKENTCELKDKTEINDNNVSISKTNKKKNLKKSRNHRNKNSHNNSIINNTEKKDHLEKRKSRVSFYLAKNIEDKDSNEIENNENDYNNDNNNLNEEEDFSVMNNKDTRKIRSKRKKTFLVGSKSNFHKYNSLLMEYTNKNNNDNNDINDNNDKEVTTLHYKNHSSWTSNDNNMLFSTKLNTETNSQVYNQNTNNNDVKSLQTNQIKQESKNGLNNTFTTIYSNLDNRNILELEKLTQPDKNRINVNRAKAEDLEMDDSILSISDNKYESSLNKTKPFIKQKTSISKFFKAKNESNNKSSFNNMIPSILNKSKTEIFENKSNKINNRKEIQYSYENEKLLESKIISIIENTKEKYDITMRNIDKERLSHVHNNVLNIKFLENITNNKKDLKLNNLKKTFLSDLNKIDAKKSLINDKLIELLNQENNIPIYLRTASCSNFKGNNESLTKNEYNINTTKTRNFANIANSNMKLHTKIESNNSINTYKSLASVKSDKTKENIGKNKHTHIKKIIDIRDIKANRIMGNSKEDSESERNNYLGKYKDHGKSVNKNLNINKLNTDSDINLKEKLINRQSGYLKNIVNLKNFISNSYNFKRIEEIENEAEDLIENEVKKSNNSLTMTNVETNTNNNKKISITITNKDRNINNYDSETNNKTSYKFFRNSNKNNSTIISNNLSNKDILNYSSRFFNHKSSKKLDSNAKKHLSFNNSNINVINNNYLSVINNKRSEKQLNEFVQIFMKLNNSNNIADRKSSKEKVIKAFQNFYYLNDDENEKNFIKRNHNV